MSLIDPNALPGEGLRPWVVDAEATTLKGLGSDISDGGAATLRAWQAISASYQSDGAEGLYDVMTPVGQATTAIGDGFATVSAALATYAAETTPIQQELSALKAEAQTFVYQANNYQPHEQATTDIWVKASNGVMGFIAPPKVTIDSWDQDQGMVDKNNDLIRRGADLAEQWLQAQQKCAAAILGAAGQSPDSTRGQQSPAQLMAAAEEMMPKLPWEGEKDISTPWGSTGSRQESCGEKTLGFPAHLVGGVVTGAYKMVQGVNTLLTGYDGTGVPWYAELAAGAIMGRKDVTDDAWSRAGATYSSAWLGLGHLANAINPVKQGWDAVVLSPVGDLLPEGIREPIVDDARQDVTALADTVGGLVGLKLPDEWWDAKSWDGYNIAQAWVDNPGGATGESAFNIGSFFIPGAGEASAAAHGAGAAGAAAHGAEAVGDAARVGTEGAEAAARGASKADAFVDAAHGVTEADLGNVVKGIDDGTLKGIDHLDFDPADIPVNDVKIPDDVAGLQRDWAGSDAPTEHVPLPEREPALVGASHDAAAADSASDAAHGPKSELNAADGPVDSPRPAETSTGGEGSSHTSSGTGESGGSGSHGGSGAGHDGGGSSGGGHGGGDGDGVGEPGGPDGSTPGDPGVHQGPVPENSMLLPTGETHAIHGSPDNLAASAQEAHASLESTVASHGLSMKEFNELAYHTPIDKMSLGDAQLLHDIRHSLPEPKIGEEMQKIISQTTMEKYFNGHFSDGGSLRGFVSKASDGAALHTPAEAFDGLGLGYKGTDFSKADDAVYAIRYKNDGLTEMSIPDGQLAAEIGRPGYIDPNHGYPGDPFLGNGFAGTGHKVLPELKVTDEAGRLPDGAEMWRIDKNGHQTLHAVLTDQAKTWFRVAP